MRSWRVSVALVVAIAGCATLRRQGDDAFERKSYVEAAELYDQALQEDPKDDKARASRARAREAALTELLDNAKGHRAQGSGSQARAELARFFRFRRRWVMSTPPALVSAVEREASAAAIEVAAAIQPLLAANAPLAAEAALKDQSLVVDEPELAAARRKLRAEIRDAGRLRCDHYRGADRGADGGPYWGWLVARYCRHFGRDAASPALPYLAGGIDVDGTISGMSAASSGMVVQQLHAALAGTPWYDAGASERIAGSLRGAYRVTYQSGPVTVQAPWTERVSYLATETRRVPHQVSELHSENYFVQVPYTTSQSESYSCGDSRSYRTCTRSKMVTQYRSEMRSRLVTRWHTEYRTVSETVTRWRNVRRVFSYTAEKRRSSYALASTLTVNLPPDGAALELPLAGSEVVEAMRHDVSFEPAGVEPQPGQLPSGDEWLRSNVGHIVDRLKGELRRGWQARFCGRDEFTTEEAVRCLYGRSLVAAATAALRPVAGTEADALAALAVSP
jgi:hypothetical protein